MTNAAAPIDGMIILETITTAKLSILSIIFLLSLPVGSGIIIIFCPSDCYDIVLGALIPIISVVALCLCLAESGTTTVKALFTKPVEIQAVQERYKIKSIDGQIFTLIEKEIEQ